VTIAAGTRFGPYEVVSALGAGGMGEVYLARDTTLGRQVALKVLPDDVARDPDRIARFRREAQILAALNHPLIAAIYGVEDSQATPVLVLELVEGPTLAERISQGPIPLDDALAIARQLAQALEAAHEQGIVHRDLKPANIKLRPDGTVKVLDFGLARALLPTLDTLGKTSSDAATMTGPLVTRPGVVLGTTAYMSPEQARGLVSDRGADIWAFGAVFFEMLTGRRAFDGDDPAQTLASVLRSDPDWSRLPVGTPESVRRVLRRCLEKERGRRLADVRDARLDIEDAQAGDSPRVIRTTRPRSGERLLWIAALSAVAIVAGSLAWKRDAPSPTLRERRVEISTPPTSDPVSLALSPDGEKVAFIAYSDGRPQLWVRMLESGAAQPLRGTDGAAFPFWSPDSRTIGFFAAEKINRVELNGGSVPKVLGPAVIGPGATWNSEGTIVFPAVPDSPLFRISANGGAVTPVPGLDPKMSGQRYPQFLPDGRHFLYFVAESRGIFVGALDNPNRRKLFDADSAAVFAPPAEVLFVRDGVLYAQRFDASRLLPQGDPIVLARGIAVHPYGGAAVSASAAGSIAYRTGAGTPERQFVWFDRSGKRVGVVGAPDRSGPLNPSLSPDGRQVAFSRTIDGNTDLWVADVERGVPRKFTSHRAPDICPVWAPDSASIVFSTPGAPGTHFGLHVKPVSTDGEAAPLFADLPRAIAMDYSMDGQYVVYRTAVNNQWDIWAVPMKGNRTPFPVLQSGADERTAQLSPNSRWLAYESNETGQFEIYVRPFPGSGASRRVSPAGGSQPRWSSNGSELFYISPDSQLTLVPVRPLPGGSDLTLGVPARLFPAPTTSTVQGGVSFEYAVSTDGQRFLVNTIVQQAVAPISLILNRKPLAN
jgi:serine/threonine protein kinase